MLTGDTVTKREKELLTLVELLLKENDCLRSVLSEWDSDKSCYTQMNVADDLRRVIENLYCTTGL